jgi:hypothetical protein
MPSLTTSVVFALAIASPLVAEELVGQESKTSPDAPASTGLLSKSAQDPYKGLFVGPARRNPAPNASHIVQGSGDRSPRVVCGMLIIPADPSLDPGMKIQPPDAERYTLRVLKPPMCGSAQVLGDGTEQPRSNRR